MSNTYALKYCMETAVKKQKEGRQFWIDLCRGVGILFVLLGHTDLPKTLYRLVYGFHLPLFFILSGYLFCAANHNELPLKDYIKKLVRSYLFPYFVLCGINLILSFLGHFAGIIKDFSFSRYLRGIIIYSWGTREWLPNCSPLWFLTCLFCALVLFYWIMHCKNWIVRILLVLLCVGTSYVLDLLDAPKLYWNTDSAMMAVVFLAIGALLYDYSFLDAFNRLKALSCGLICVGCAILGGIAIYINRNVSFNFNEYGNLPLMLIGATLMCFSVIQFCIMISGINTRNPITAFTSKVGKHTLLIMGFDYFAWGLVSFVTDRWYFEFPLKCLILLIIGFVYLMTISYIRNGKIRSALSF